MFGRQDVAGCNGDVGVSEVDVVGKKMVRFLTLAYLGSEEYVVGKQDGAMRNGIRKLPEGCETFGLIEENVGTHPVL